jgi:hypothetical protein
MSSDTRKITVTGNSSVFRVDGGDATSKTRRRKTNTTSQSQSQSQPQHRAIVKIGGDAIQSTHSAGTTDAGMSSSNPSRGRDGTTDAGISSSIPSRGRDGTMVAVKEITVKQREEPTTSPVTVSKVILGGKKPKHMKVVLTKKNHEITPAVTSSKPNRKVSLGLTHLKRRVTRARRLNKLSKTAPIEQIKKELITAHIIKTDSKAPEHILRQMYSDTKLLTSKSL